MLKPFGPFGFFYTPNFIWAPLIIEDFFMPPSMGCDPSQDYFSQEKLIKFKNGLQRILSLWKECQREML
jgi:hypothetical protein